MPQVTEPHREPAMAAPVRRDATSRTSPRTAIWNAVAALAIIAVLFVTFYGLNTQRDSSTERPTAAAPAPAQTTGQGGSENTGQGAR
jgi:hypothetical protein